MKIFCTLRYTLPFFQFCNEMKNTLLDFHVINYFSLFSVSKRFPKYLIQYIEM